jgi:hypothetical protein
MKEKKCKVCSEKFTPLRPLQAVCSAPCGYIYARRQQEKNWQREKKVRKEKLMSRGDWEQMLQKVFNTYIRKRDEGKPCISCGTNLKGKVVHASHYFSVGAYPNLRFNEDNVHSSCNHCNVFLHGNTQEYSIRLPERIGKERFEELKSMRNGEPLKLTVDEIKEKIIYYRKKIKDETNR